MGNFLYFMPLLYTVEQVRDKIRCRLRWHPYGLTDRSYQHYCPWLKGAQEKLPGNGFIDMGWVIIQNRQTHHTQSTGISY